MTARRLAAWPRSLPGQMALLVALALFVAQAINFAMFLQARRQLRFEQVTGPAVTRLVDAAERTAVGRPPASDRGRVRLLALDPIRPEAPRDATVEQAVAAGLAEAGHPADTVHTGIEPRSPEQLLDHHHDGFRRADQEIVIAVHAANTGWLVLRAPWPGNDGFIIWRLIGQTLILYVVVLLPVLWIGWRIARPLRLLGEAAQRFRPGADPAPLAEQGPHDVRQVIAAFNALRLRVTAMLEEKDRMLGAIGHDLRTPLAALRVRIESVEDEADRARMADTITEMNRTLDDILSLARLGRPSEPPVEVDLAALVDAVVEDFRDLGQDVRFADSGRVTARLRPSLMRRAVRNLVENAVKYGGGAAVSVERANGRLRVIVADNGPGIPPDRLEHVFDAFTRLETSRNRDTGGIGLGLALARAIVREAGGEITLANRAAGGLEAIIALPT